MTKRNLSPETWETLAQVYEAQIDALKKRVDTLEGQLYLARLQDSNAALNAHIATQAFINQKLNF